MKQKTVLIWGSVSLFFLFVLFSYLVQKNYLVQFDFNTTVRIQDKISRRFDDFLSLFSFFGSFEISSLLLLGIILLRRKLVEGMHLFFYSGILFFELFGKIFVSQKGPPILFARYTYDISYPTSYIPHPTDAYPSGHSGRTIFICTILAYLLLTSKKIPKGGKIIGTAGILSYGFIMLVSRVYLGEHWITDVIGGTLLGISLGLLSIITVEKTKLLVQRKKE